MGDEVFYYDQAIKLRQGVIENFQNTQPFAYPVFLAITFISDLTILRIINSAIVSISVYFLFLYTEKFFSKKTATLSTLIFIVNPWTVQIATILYTESLFLLFLILSFILYEKFKEKNEIKISLLLGLFLGLAIETRIVGIFLPAFFLIRSIFDRRLTKFLPALVLSILIFLPYQILTSGKFIQEKVYWTGFDRYLFSSALVELFTIPFAENLLLGPAVISIGVFMFGLVIFYGSYYLFYKKSDIVFFIILFTTAFTFTSNYLWGRYFLPLLPFFSIAIVYGYELSKKLKEKIIEYGYLFFFIIYFSTSFIDATGVLFGFERPIFLSFNRFYTVPPSGCMLLDKDWTLYHGDINSTINLPKFDQYGNADYLKSVSINDSYSKIVVSNGDDGYELFINDNFIDKTQDSVFKPHTTYYQLNPGEYNFRFFVYNRYNIGGIGQVMLCK